MFSDASVYFFSMIFYVFTAVYLVASLPSKGDSVDRSVFATTRLFLQPRSSSVRDSGSSSDDPARDCRNERVFCIDDCSFLCSRRDGFAFRCVDNVCVEFRKGGNEEDEKKKKKKREGGEDDGCVMGYEVQTGSGSAKRRKCLCYDPMLFGGERCERPVPDVCEHGVFLFGRDESPTCLCHPPYGLMFDEYEKPHCLEKKWKPFFRRGDSFTTALYR